MKVKEIMTEKVVRIAPEESVAVAARRLAHHNIGLLPVCDGKGAIRGVITDRDIVTRCIGAGLVPSGTAVGQIMTSRVLSVGPEVDTGVAAYLMGREQVRRLPVVSEGVLCGMVSLSDLAVREDGIMDAADALSDISSNVAGEKGW